MKVPKPERSKNMTASFFTCILILRRMRKQTRFIYWNEEGWKTGICSVPPVGLPYSLLNLSNNLCIKHTFENLENRFMKLYRRKANLHHYTKLVQRFSSIINIEHGLVFRAARNDFYTSYISINLPPYINFQLTLDNTMHVVGFRTIKSGTVELGELQHLGTERKTHYETKFVISQSNKLSKNFTWGFHLVCNKAKYAIRRVAITCFTVCAIIIFSGPWCSAISL